MICSVVVSGEMPVTSTVNEEAVKSTSSLDLTNAFDTRDKYQTKRKKRTHWINSIAVKMLLATDMVISLLYIDIQVSFLYDSGDDDDDRNGL